MNRVFLLLVFLYLVVVLPLIWLTDLTVNARDDLQLFRVALYTPIVISSVIMAGFAVSAAIKEHLDGQQRGKIVTWPPEWDYNVAGWATSKALFFIVLWMYGMGWQIDEWWLTGTLALFAFGHTMFTAQWIGPDGLEREP